MQSNIGFLRMLHLKRSIVTSSKLVRLFSGMPKQLTLNTLSLQHRSDTGTLVTPSLESVLFQRCLSLSHSRLYELLHVRNENKGDMKLDAVDIFQSAVCAVYPKSMIQNTLHFDSTTSVLRVEEKNYQLDRNVYVVGFGSAVLGMARSVEDLLGEHIVTGIISIPHGLQEELRAANRSEMLLSPNTKLQLFEGVADNEKIFDKASVSASAAIHNLVSKLSMRDVLIVLVSGGGSVLYPSPHPSISLEDLHHLIRLLVRNGATTKELNTLRKNIETLKGGGLAMKAKPAKVLTLILSSIIGDPAEMVASGPTCPAQRTPHQCLEILNRLNIMDKTPESVRKYLERECKDLTLRQLSTAQNPSQAKAEQDAIWKDVQNVIVGNNSRACDAAAVRAHELGYLPIILSKTLTTETNQLGSLSPKLAHYVMMCYDRKSSLEPNAEIAQLELELVSKGIKKSWINSISNGVDKAHHTNLNMCIIAGGEIVIHVAGTGKGGKNMETALAAAVQMKEEFRNQDVQVTPMCFLSCDSVGHDGITNMAGAVVDQEFLDEVANSGLDMKSYLMNNDSFTFFNEVNGGRNMVHTRLTGTNVMDLVVMLIQRPKC